MEVLFVCRANGGRSPMAEGIFNKFSRKNRASSAGIDVAKEGNTGKPANPKNVEVMKEIGCDISRHKRRQLSKTVAAHAGVIVFMTSKKKLPAYLKNSKKVRFWRILNPKGRSVVTRRQIRDRIKIKVKGLILELG